MEGIRGEFSVAELSRKYGISDTTYYKWNKEFIEAGKVCLEGDILSEATSLRCKNFGSQNQDLKMALAVWADNEYKHKTQFPNEMWQTDFIYFKIKGFGWYYRSTVLDDYSRYIIHWELCS